jgi:HD-like signal output (HDOD) protein
MATMVTLDTILQRVKDLPPLPAVINEVRRVLEEDEGTAKDLARVVLGDPALAAKILRLANSPFYGMSHRISTIQHAVVVLGFRTTGLMVQALAVQGQLMSHGSQGSGRYDTRRLWRHALAAGIGTRLLAQGTPRLSLQMVEEGFLAGLLHDIGKLVLVHYVPDLAERLQAVEHTEPLLPDYLVERQAIGFDHHEIGAALLEHWRFPPLFVEVARGHHEPGKAEGSLEGNPLIGLLLLAELLCAGVEGDVDPDRALANAVNQRFVPALGLSENTIVSAAKALPALIEETVKAWGGVCP